VYELAPVAPAVALSPVAIPEPVSRPPEESCSARSVIATGSVAHAQLLSAKLSSGTANEIISLSGPIVVSPAVPVFAETVFSLVTGAPVPVSSGPAACEPLIATMHPVHVFVNPDQVNDEPSVPSTRLLYTPVQVDAPELDISTDQPEGTVEGATLAPPLTTTA
jgi:hypothetical protein